MLYKLTRYDFKNSPNIEFFQRKQRILSTKKNAFFSLNEAGAPYPNTLYRHGGQRPADCEAIIP